MAPALPYPEVINELPAEALRRTFAVANPLKIVVLQ